MAIKKMLVVLAAIVLSAYWPAAVSLRPEEISVSLRRSLATSGVDIRLTCSGDRLQEHWNSLSVGCADVLTAHVFNSSNYRSSLRGLCQQCGEPLYRLIVDCVGESARLLRSMDTLCAVNERGITCYEALVSQTGEDEGKEMFSDCVVSPCSEACRRDLVASNERHGCCLFSSVAALSDEERAEGLWRRCGVEPPAFCNGAFTSSSSSDSSDSSSSAEDQRDKSSWTFTAVALVAILCLM